MTKSHAPLFKETTTGAIQQWWIEQDGGQYRMHSGQVEGKTVVSAWTVAKPKNVGRSNESSGADQASAEIASAYELKRKKGYCTSIDAARASERFQCMLAEPYNQKPKETDASYQRRMAKIFDETGNSKIGPIYMQPKLDGIRCIANANGLWSREGNPILSVPHVFDVLKPLFAHRPELIVDGELYNHDFKYDFNKIVSLVKKLKPDAEDLELSRELVQYWTYDCVTEDLSHTFSQRFIHDFCAYGDDYFHGIVQKVPTFEGLHRLDLDPLYEMFLEQGYEGGMYRWNVPYEYKRTYSLLKRKEKMDAEFVVVSFEEGDGNAAGMAKVAHLEITLADGTTDTFKADICGTREECREYLIRRDEAVGKLATIEFQNYTPDGIPRFPKLKTAHFTPRW